MGSRNSVGAACNGSSDNSHILITDKLAEELISLSDEYKKIIQLISEYEIKHGQVIRVYSVHSKNFGNPNLPEKIRIYLAYKN